MNDSDRLTVAHLLEQLGFSTLAGDLDETLRWALIELKLRREDRTTYIYGPLLPPDPVEMVVCNKCGRTEDARDSIDCTECTEWFCDNCYNTDLGDGCHCHREAK